LKKKEEEESIERRNGREKKEKRNRMQKNIWFKINSKLKLDGIVQ